MALRIWLNRTYSQHVHTIRLLRENPDDVEVEILGTHQHLDSPVLQACDVASAEPDLRGDAYVDFALDYCRCRGVDVFIPRLELSAIARRAEEFREHGVAVMCSPHAAIELLDDKELTYRAADAVNCPIPPWRVVTTAEEFAQAYADLSSLTDQICLKPVVGVGGEGFRLIDNRPADLEQLLGDPLPSVSSDWMLEALVAARARGRPVPRMMLMPYLADPEVSVDCLSGPDGEVKLTLARSKLGRHGALAHHPEAQALAHELATHFGLRFLSNVQFRVWHDSLHLLEINPRAAAGVFQTALCGVNLPWAAIRLALSLPAMLGSPVLPVGFASVPDVIRLHERVGQVGAREFLA